MTENKSQRGNTGNKNSRTAESSKNRKYKRRKRETEDSYSNNFQDIKIDCSTRTERSGNKK